MQGTTTWTSVGTASSYSRAVALTDPAFELRVTVTSAGQTATDTQAVAVVKPCTAGITGNTSVATAGTYTWQANASCPSTYSWQYRVQGTTTWTSVGTASSYSRAVAAGNPHFELRVTVTSNGVTASDTHLVSVNIFTVGITGPTNMVQGESGIWTANVTGAPGPVSYQWEFRLASSTTWTSVGTGSSYSRNAPFTSFYLRVTVTSGSATASDEHYVFVQQIIREPCDPTCQLQ